MDKKAFQLESLRTKMELCLVTSEDSVCIYMLQTLLFGLSHQREITGSRRAKKD